MATHSISAPDRGITPGSEGLLSLSMRFIELHYRSIWLMVGYLLMGLVVWLSLAPSPPDLRMDEANLSGHFLAYFTLTFWFLSMIERCRWCRIAMGFMAMGLILELIQGATGYRHFDLLDILSGFVGVGLALLAASSPLCSLMSKADQWIADKMVHS